MTPTIEILERVNRNSQKNKDEVFTRWQWQAGKQKICSPVSKAS